MIAVIPADELVLARMAALLEVLADELHRRFDGFRSAAERLDVDESRRRDRAHLFHEIERDIGDAVQRRRERHRVDLPPHRFHQARMPMSERRDKDATDSVEVALSVNVPEVESLGPAEDDWPLQKLRGRLIIDEGAFEQRFLADGLVGCEVAAEGAGHDQTDDRRAIGEQPAARVLPQTAALNLARRCCGARDTGHQSYLTFGSSTP
jgi:hypothetical protein